MQAQLNPIAEGLGLASGVDGRLQVESDTAVPEVAPSEPSKSESESGPPRTDRRASAKRTPRKKPGRDYSTASELLDPWQIAAEGGPAVRTQYVWKCTGRYGWDRLIVKVGRLSRIPRDKWEAWKEQRLATNIDQEL